MDRFSGDYIRQQPEYRYLVHKDSLHRVIQTCVEDGEVKLRFGHVSSPPDGNTVRLPERGVTGSRSHMIKHAASAVYHLTTLQLERLAAARQAGRDTNKHPQLSGPRGPENQATTPTGTCNVTRGHWYSASNRRMHTDSNERAIPNERTHTTPSGRADAAAPNGHMQTTPNERTDTAPNSQKKFFGVSDPTMGKVESLSQTSDSITNAENVNKPKRQRRSGVVVVTSAMATNREVSTTRADHGNQNSEVSEEVAKVGASSGTENRNDKSSTRLISDSKNANAVNNCLEKSITDVLKISAAAEGKGTTESDQAAAWAMQTGTSRQDTEPDRTRDAAVPLTNADGQERTRDIIVLSTNAGDQGQSTATAPISPADPVVNGQTTGTEDEQSALKRHDVNAEISKNDFSTKGTGVELNSSHPRVPNKANNNVSDGFTAESNVVKEVSRPAVAKDKKKVKRSTPRGKSLRQFKPVQKQQTPRGNRSAPSKNTDLITTPRKKKTVVTASPQTSQDNPSSWNTTGEEGQKGDVFDVKQPNSTILDAEPHDQPDEVESTTQSLQTAVSHYGNSCSKQERCEVTGDRKTVPQNVDIESETQQDGEQKRKQRMVAQNANDKLPVHLPEPLIHMTDSTVETPSHEVQQCGARVKVDQVDTQRSRNDHPASNDRVQPPRIDTSEENRTSLNCNDKPVEPAVGCAENVDVFPQPVTRVDVVETHRQTCLPGASAVSTDTTHCQQTESDVSCDHNPETEISPPRFVIPVVVLDEASTDGDGRSEYSDDADAVSIDADEYLALVRCVNADKQQGEDSSLLALMEENKEAMSRLTNRVLRNHNRNYARSSHLTVPFHPKSSDDKPSTEFSEELDRRLKAGSEFSRRYSTPGSLEAVGLRRSLTPSTFNVEFQSHVTIRPSTPRETEPRRRRASSPYSPKEARPSLLTPPAVHEARGGCLKSAMSNRRSSLNCATGPMHCHWNLGLTETVPLSRQVSWVGHKASHGPAPRRRSSVHVPHRGHAGHAHRVEDFPGSHHATGVIKEDDVERPKSESGQSSRKHSDTRRVSTVSAGSTGRRSLTAEELEDHELLQHQMSQNQYDPRVEKAERYIHQRENTFNRASQYLSPVRSGLRNVQVHYSQTNTNHNDGIIFAHLLRAAHIRNTAVEEGVYTMERRLYTRRHATTLHATTFYDTPEIIKAAKKGNGTSGGVCSPQTKKKRERRERIQKKNNQLEMGYTPTALSLKELGPEDIAAVRSQCRHLRVSPALQQHLYSTDSELWGSMASPTS